MLGHPDYIILYIIEVHNERFKLLEGLREVSF